MQNSNRIAFFDTLTKRFPVGTRLEPLLTYLGSPFWTLTGNAASDYSPLNPDGTIEVLIDRYDRWYITERGVAIDVQSARGRIRCYSMVELPDGFSPSQYEKKVIEESVSENPGL